MNECLWLLIGFIGIVVIVLYIAYLHNLHNRVCRLERKASPRLEIIEREVHGIGCYMRILVGLAIFFCLCVSVHYLCYCHPQILNNGAPKPDALGTVVAIFGVITTLLVGWQIYNTINARKELETFKKETAETFNKRISYLEECCQEGRSNIVELRKNIATYSVLQERVMQIMESELAELYLTQLAPTNNKHRIEFHYLNHRIQAIIRASNLGDIPGCNIQTRATLESIKDVKKIMLSKTMKQLLVDGVLSVKNPQSITDFAKLSNLINNITEKQS